MKKFYILYIIWFAIGCVSIKGVIENPVAREKRLRTAINQHFYPMHLSQLKELLIASWNDWHSLPTTYEQDQQVQERLDDGFTFRGRFYQKSDASLLETLTENDELKDQALKSFLVDNDYIVLQDDRRIFRIEKDAHLFVGRYISPTKSTLEIFRIREVKFGNWNIDGKQKSLLEELGYPNEYKNGPVSLENSLRDAQRSTQFEMLTMQALDPESANRIESGQN